MSILTLHHISCAERDTRLEWRERRVLVDVSVAPMMDKIRFKNAN